MQQFFINEKIDIGTKYYFTLKQKHHVIDVVRLDNELIRLVSDGQGYFARVINDGKEPYALIEEIDTNYNELKSEVHLAMALIRKEKFELVLQKATELGVNKIIPFVSSRCVVKEKKNKLDRYEEILLMASEQCKRNIVPTITSTISYKELVNYKQTNNLIAYEKSDSKLISEEVGNKENTLIVIGPEGGFSEDEISLLTKDGFKDVSLGSRILRAETAAIYSCSILAELFSR